MPISRNRELKLKPFYTTHSPNHCVLPLPHEVFLSNHALNTFWNLAGSIKAAVLDWCFILLYCFAGAKGQEPCANQWPVNDELVPHQPQQPIITIITIIPWKTICNLALKTCHLPPWWVPLPKSPWPQCSLSNKPNPSNPSKDKFSLYSLFDYIIKTPEHQLVYSWYSSALPFSLTYSCAATNNHLTSVILFAQVAFRVSVALYSHHCTTQRWKPRQVDTSIIP